MTILNVEDMVVGAKQVNYQVARRSKKIQAAIEAKEPDEVIDETEDTDAKSKEDQKKSKRKKKKGKNDDEKNDK